MGDTCNLRCSYCYLGDKVRTPRRLMGSELLTLLIREVAALGRRVEFLWHGGEPLLAGTAFFREVLRLQAEQNSTAFQNFIQTNATLLDEEWAALFADAGFNVRLSLDGPQVVHDRFRLNHDGRASHRSVADAVALLTNADIQPQVSCVITEQSAGDVEEIYEYFCTLGIREVSFLPAFATVNGEEILPITLTPESYVAVYTKLYDLWSADTRPIRVREVESIVSALVQGYAVGDCTTTGACATVARVENDGRVFPCELHEGEDAELYGRIGEEPLSHILARRFEGRVACLSEAMKAEASSCKWFRLCHGGCYAARVARRGGGQRHFYCCDARGRVFAYVEERLARSGDRWAVEGEGYGRERGIQESV